MAITKPMKEHSLQDLDRIFREQEECDSNVFSEMRSNLLLVAGQHYQKSTSNFYKRIKESHAIPEQVKLRITKNHIQKITRTYVSNITSLAPGVSVSPKNESEIQDQKVAEMNEAVWQDLKLRHNMPDLVDDWGDDFVGIGEVATKIFWDPNAGKIKAYEQKLDEKGQPLYLDAQDQETAEQTPNLAPGKPQYAGDLVYEPIYGFNLLRMPEAKSIDESDCLTIKKMVDVETLKAQFPEFEEQIKSSVDETMMVFDTHTSTYVKAGKQVMIREFHFRSCPRYPKGYFYMTTKEVIFAKGEHPGGIFPIIVQAFDKIQTSARGKSPIHTMRPYQIEINRAASKMAEHQITLGDDKLLIQNNTKISAGVALPGVRSINYTGMEPVVLAGRAGEQYLNYMQAQIQEMYQVLNVAEDSADKPDGAVDPFSLLFKAASQKKKFTRYTRRFEAFLKKVCWTSLELYKIHAPDDAVIYAVGRKEQVNIAEFRTTTDLCYQIKIEEQAEDIETKMGRQMVLNHALQYVGNKLEKEDIGKLMKAMPYANFDQSFDDMTLDYDSGTNMILAMDRGERPALSEYDNFVYLIKRLVSRMRLADFKFLDPMVQQNYEQIVGKMQELEAQRQQAIQMAEQGYIPTGGYLVPCDVYVSDPANPLKTRRARIPYQSIEWLIQKLETQGSSLDQLEKMNEGSQAQIATIINQKQGGAPNGMGAAPSPAGTDTPGGVSNAAQYGRTGDQPIF